MQGLASLETGFRRRSGFFLAAGAAFGNTFIFSFFCFVFASVAEGEAKREDQEEDNRHARPTWCATLLLISLLISKFLGVHGSCSVWSLSD